MVPYNIMIRPCKINNLFLIPVCANFPLPSGYLFIVVEYLISDYNLRRVYIEKKKYMVPYNIMIRPCKINNLFLIPVCANFLLPSGYLFIVVELISDYNLCANFLLPSGYLFIVVEYLISDYNLRRVYIEKKKI